MWLYILISDEFPTFTRQTPCLWEEVIIFWILFPEFHEISLEVALSRKIVHAREVIYPLIRFHLFKDITCYHLICPTYISIEVLAAIAHLHIPSHLLCYILNNLVFRFFIRIKTKRKNKLILVYSYLRDLLLFCFFSSFEVSSCCCCFYLNCKQMCEWNLSIVLKEWRLRL